MKPEVQEQLRASTRDARREDVDRCLSVIEVGLEEAEKELFGYGTPSNGPAAIALTANVDSLREAKDFLKSL